MNALLIHQGFVSRNEPGGTRHYEFAQRLSTHGDKLIVVASQVSYLDARPIGNRRKRLYYHDNVDNIEVIRAYAPSVHNRSFFWRIVSFLVFSATSVWAGLSAGPTDLVMGTTPPIFQALSAWLVACLRRKPFVLEVRDLWPEFAIQMGILRNPIAKLVSRWVEAFLYHSAKCIIINSPAYRQYLLNKGIRSDKIELVANGVDIEAFDPSATGSVFREKFGLQSKFLIVYAGAHGQANDLGTLLSAARQVQDRSDIHFLFAGDGKDRSALESEANVMGLRNVTFIGAVPKAQMPEVLAAADVCVATLMNIPMFTTTYPNKVFDYMAAGRPTLLAIDGVIREIIDASGGGVFIPPGDSDALVSAIKYLNDNPLICHSMGRAARAYVAANFDRDEQAECLRQILHHVRDN